MGELTPCPFCARAEAAEAELAEARADLPAIPIPPCTVCGETNDLHPVVWLRDGFHATGPGASYFGQFECWVCDGRGPRGNGPTPDAALRDALTRAQVEADRHRAWVAAGRPEQR